MVDPVVGASMKAYLDSNTTVNVTIDQSTVPPKAGFLMVN